MDGLANFCKEYNVDFDALSRIKKRVYVVGRFNNRQSELPEVHLFTNRTDLKDKYKRNFTTSPWQMDYGRFVEALSPRVAERIEYDDYMKFNAYTLVIPDASRETKTTTYVMDTYNYFFQRAVLTCEQEALRNDNPDLPRMLESSEVERGRTILKQIRSNLTEFCLFQKESPKIVGCFIKLLATCAGDHGLPNYAQGAPLPTGFVERLIEFIYQEDNTSSFSSEGIDFDAPMWAGVKARPAARQTFENLVTAFRDALIKDDVSQFTHIVFLGKSLSQQAIDAIPKEVRKTFRLSREAFNGLRQILRSKVLLSMVLDWLLHSYYIMIDGQPSQNDYDQDDRIEKAILNGEWQTDEYPPKTKKLAPPVKRPLPEERQRFSKALTTNFGTIVACIVATNDADKAKHLAKLPGPLIDLVEKLSADPVTRKAIVTMAGVEISEDMQTAFIQASRIIMLDVLCPVLYRSPIVTRAELKKLVRQETITAYLTSVFLSSANENAVRKVAEKNLEYFESKIDSKTKMIKDDEEIQAVLLKDFVGVLCNPDLQEEVTNGTRALAEGFSLLEAVDDEKSGGIAPIAVTRSGDEGAAKDPLKRTSPSMDIVKVGVTNKVKAAAGKILRAAAAADSAAAAASGGNGATAGHVADDGSEGAVATAVATDEETAAEDEDQVETGDTASSDGTETSSALDRSIDSILQKLSHEKDLGRVKDTEKKDLLMGKASGTLLGDKKFMDERRETLAAFERTLHYIYNRYSQHKDEKKQFRNSVERMTLLNLLLKFQSELGIGQDHSNLYRLLIDLVLHLDAENPDPKTFMMEKSLTEYFDDAKLKDGGITALRQTLLNQATKSLGNVENFVSELRGVKYLMDTLKHDRDAEIIVLNATAQEFLKWIERDSLTPGESPKGLLQAGKLVKHDDKSQRIIPPGLIYMTDSAFGNQRKDEWLQSSLATFIMKGSGEGNEQSCVLPPIVLSTGPMRNSMQWRDDAERMREAAKDCPAPVLILGPSPNLNEPTDGFKTFLPAGYLFCAHFVGIRSQGITTPGQPFLSKGRARAIGRGAAPMVASLDLVLWGEGGDDKYAFAYDFYLYIVLLLWATVEKFGGQKPPASEFFDRFFYLADPSNASQDYRSSSLLDPALIGGNALAFALNQPIGEAPPLESVSIATNYREKLANEFTARRESKDVAWFNIARASAGI